MKIVSIGENGIEDFLDEGLEECFLNDFYTFLNTLNPDEEENCAKIAGINATLAMGRMTAQWVSFMLAEKLAEGMIKRAGLYWSYINMGKLKKVIGKKIPTGGFMGKAGGFLFKNILMSDTTATRVETVKTMQTELNRLDEHSFQYQKIMSSNQNNVHKKTDTAMRLKEKKKAQALQLARHKSMTSTWTNSTADKKIFIAVTGQTVTNTGAKSWAKQYKELNQLSTYAKDLEGNFLSQAQVTLDSFILSRAEKMR
jgi:hypothetical protein